MNTQQTIHSRSFNQQSAAIVLEGNLLYIAKKAIDVMVKASKGGGLSRNGSFVHFYIKEGAVGMVSSNGHTLSLFEGPSDGSVQAPSTRDEGLFLSLPIEALKRYKVHADKRKHVCIGVAKNESTGRLDCSMASAEENFVFDYDVDYNMGPKIISMGMRKASMAKACKGGVELILDPNYLEVPSKLKSVPGFTKSSVTLSRESSNLDPLVMTAKGDEGRFVYLLMPLRE